MSSIAEERIKELEQQVKAYKDIIDSLGIDIYWKDSNGKLLGANKKFINTLQTDEKNIIGKSEEELIGIKNQEEISNYERVAQLANTNIFLREEYKDKNSKVGTFLTQRKIIKDENDNVVKIIVISIDNNQFKDTDMNNSFMVENLDVTFQQIINTIDANIYWKNIQGQYIGMNQSNAESLKITDIKDAFYKNEVELLGNDDELAKNILMNDLKVICTGSNISYEETYHTKDNRLGIYLSTKSCLKDNNGNVIGLVGVSVDITERKELEEKIQQQNEELKKKDEIKNQFIQNFSHDLKVPINGLLGRTQLLKILLSASSNQKITQIVEDVENSSMTLETLFNQMRDLVIHEQFDNKIHKTEFTLLDLVNKEFEIAKSSIPPSKNININISTNNNLNNKINSDYYKLSQIIRNLLSNAIKYTDKGNISIKAEALKEDNHINFEFSVADTGIGIGKDHQNSIFEIFNRADITSHKNNRHGMGVGLYIVKNNLDILNGSINLESSLGQGSIFTVKIPL